MVIFITCSFGPKIPFLGKFSPKNQNRLKWNLALDYFKYAEFDGPVTLFSFGPEIPFLGKFGPNRLNYLIKIKVGT